MATTQRFDQLTRLAAALFLLTIVAFQIFVFGVVIRTLLPNSIDWGTTWDNSEKITGAIEHIVTIAALVVGGTWTYYRFIKGRVLISRLELGVSGEVIQLHNATYLRVSVTLENVGSSKVEITQKGVGLDVFAEGSRPAVSAEDAQEYKVRNVSWNRLLPFVILEKHAWIEPGETIHDQKLLEILIKEEIAYKIDLVIFAGRTKWTATCVVLPKENGEGES
jgi:hypothetical protein